MDAKNHSEAVAKLGQLIKDIKFAMFTTVEPDGTLRSRPMVVQLHKFDGDLWFFTKGSSPKVHEIMRDEHVNVSLSSPEHQRYISVSGRAQFVKDREKIREFWNPAFAAWFEKGVDDPDLALIKVSVESAEYWDSPSSPASYLFGFLKTRLTGRSRDIGDHQKMDLRH